MEDILSQALTACLVNIQYFSKDDPNALLYFCINQSHLVGGIRSAVHSLNENSIPGMVKQFMLDFYRFVNSNADIRLDNTFQVYFHVSSGKIARPFSKRKAIPIRSLVGMRPPDKKILLPGSLIDLPLGCPDNPDIFKDSCALVTMVYTVLRNVKPETQAQLKHLTLLKSSNAKKNAAATVLLAEINRICLQYDLPYRGPHNLNEVIKILAEHYKVQLIVISSMIGSKPDIISHPSAFKEEMPRFYFLLKPVSTSLNHIMAINNLTTFFKVNHRAICFNCTKFYYMGTGANRSHRHKCRNFNTCPKCFGIIPSGNVVKQTNEPWVYCDNSNSVAKSNVCCSRCGVIFESSECFKNHSRFCEQNKYYWLCPVCQKSVSMKNRNPSEIARTHVCHATDKFCTLCLKYLPPQHICEVKKTQKHTIWPNLGVLSIIFQDAVGGLCQVCHLSHKDYMQKNNVTYADIFKSNLYYELLCPHHRENRRSKPNLIKLFYEKNRFEFTAETFANDNFLSDVTSLSEKINISYSSVYVAKSNSSTNKRKVRSLPSLPMSNDVSAVNQFLQFLVSVNLTNYIFFVHSNQEMLFLLEIFLANFWQPTVVQSGRLVKKIDIPSIDLKFLLFENYCGGSLYDLVKQFGLKREIHVFPMAYNTQKYFKTVLELPSFDSFLDFTDTDEVCELKLNYYRKLASPYSVTDELYKVMTENLKTFLLCVTSFVRLTFELQGQLATIAKSIEPCALHPFGANVMSLSSLAMALFKYYFLDKYDICTVLRSYTGFHSKVSSPEYEYLSFLAYTKPEDQIQHAFNSREGQKRFDHIIVDGYSSKTRTVYQFNGCIVSKKIQFSRDFH